MENSLIIRNIGLIPYEESWRRMQRLTQARDSGMADELWLLQHPSVFTQGQAGKPEHVLFSGDIPIVQTDRGGQVTYHGPGQLVAYMLFDLRRLGIGIRQLVTGLEQAVINTLSDYNISAQGRRDAPGVYVEGAKICSIGLRVKRGYSYHGIAFNIRMDTSPFQCINPCGFANLAITQVSDFVPDITVETVEQQFIPHICEIFGYTTPTFESLRPENEPTTY